METSEIWGKRIECIIGLIMLIPPILGIIAFTISIFSVNYPGDFASMKYLSDNWTASIEVPYEVNFSTFGNDIKGSAGAMSSLPIYLGLMAMVGAYLIKGNFKYLFIKSKKG